MKKIILFLFVLIDVLLLALHYHPVVKLLAAIALITMAAMLLLGYRANTPSKVNSGLAAQTSAGESEIIFTVMVSDADGGVHMSAVECELIDNVLHRNAVNEVHDERC